MKTYLKTLIVGALISIPMVSIADEIKHPHSPGIDARQHHQTARMHQGIASGELTHEEATQLREERHAARAKEHSYKADGTLTKSERKDLHKDLNAISKDIYNEKHDAEKRS